ncbi:glutathione binding-like protein [Phenylobacterium sp. LjRoot225]|uniref:glutathione binding-like protein n=1 Tax=Phenylobacterium sp. LjRoot225 TaxID=3342285 RepID=UPI003ED01E35
MKLYYSPLACSLADHIALEEAGVAYDRERVDLRTKRTASGRDFREITPKNYVPALVLETGEILTENVAVLDWIASQFPQLAVDGPLGRTRMLEALTYVTTELHHGFKPMWHPSTDEEKAKARLTLAAKLRYVAGTLAGDYLFGDEPCVADFYLFVMLRWAVRFGVEVPAALEALLARMEDRPAIQRVLREEGLPLLAARAA